MLKINLLPQYILERQKVRGMLLIFGVLLALELVGLGGFITKKKMQLNGLTETLTQKKSERLRVESIKAKADAKEAAVMPYATRAAFCRQLETTGAVWADLLEDINKYTYSNVKYNSISVTNNSVTIQGVVEGTTGAGQYLLNLMQCPRFNQVGIQGIGGYRSAPTVAFTVNCGLANPVTVPGLAGVSGGGGGGEYGGEDFDESMMEEEGG